VGFDINFNQRGVGKMGLLQKRVSREKTKGNFETRAALEFFVAARAREGVAIKEICHRAGVSRPVVDSILVKHTVTDKERLKVSKEMLKVLREENKYLREKLKESEGANRKLKATLKEWPEESHIDIIGTEGEHYERKRFRGDREL